MPKKLNLPITSSSKFPSSYILPYYTIIFNLQTAIFLMFFYLRLSIIELFEEILDQHNIKISDIERTEDDSESCLYGDTYSNLLDDVENILIDAMETLKSNPSADIQIIYEVPIYEKNRHSQLCKIGTQERLPLYNATDWNYIRFNCKNWYYEMHNGALQPFYD